MRGEVDLSECLAGTLRCWEIEGGFGLRKGFEGLDEIWMGFRMIFWIGYYWNLVK